MVKIRKYANVIERFLHGEKGQRFFNFAYSIGAAIVIWGALFKILHLPGGSSSALHRHGHGDCNVHTDSIRPSSKRNMHGKRFSRT